MKSRSTDNEFEKMSSTIINYVKDGKLLDSEYDSEAKLKELIENKLTKKQRSSLEYEIDGLLPQNVFNELVPLFQYIPTAVLQALLVSTIASVICVLKEKDISTSISASLMSGSLTFFSSMSYKKQLIHKDFEQMAKRSESLDINTRAKQVREYKMSYN